MKFDSLLLLRAFLKRFSPVSAISVAAGSVLAFAVFLGGTGNAKAAGMYDKQVTVTERSNRERQAQASAALSRIFKQLVTDPAAMQSSDIKRAVRSPDRFLKQYSYGSKTPTGYPLYLYFDQGSIERLVRSLGAPDTDTAQRDILAWVVIPHGEGQRLVNSMTAPGLVSQLQSEAGNLGIPLVFPVDMSVDSAPEAEPLIDQAIAAVGRYSAYGVLFGHINQPGDPVEWSLVTADRRTSFRSPPSDIQTAALDGLQQAKSFLNAEFGALTAVSAGNGLLLEVSGINTLQEYAALQTYLESLMLVHSAALGKVFGDTVTYEVVLKDSSDRFTALLEREGKLSPVTTPVPQADTLPTLTDSRRQALRYYWR